MYVALFVNSQVVGCANVVWRMDGLGTKTKVADGNTTTLLGIILKIGLLKESKLENRCFQDPCDSRRGVQ